MTNTQAQTGSQCPARVDMRTKEGKGGCKSGVRQFTNRHPVLLSPVSIKQPLQAQLAGDERVEGFQEAGVYVEVRLGNLNCRSMTLI